MYAPINQIDVVARAAARAVEEAEEHLKEVLTDRFPEGNLVRVFHARGSWIGTVVDHRCAPGYFRVRNFRSGIETAQHYSDVVKLSGAINLE